MKTIRRTKLADGTHEILEYSHHTILSIVEDGIKVWLVREEDADPNDLDDNVDCCWSLKSAEKSREAVSWCEVEDDMWKACQ